MPKIQLTYHTRYNGWSLNLTDAMRELFEDDEDLIEEFSEEIADTLPEFTFDGCDEDGEWMDRDMPVDKITDAVSKLFGKDVEVNIEFDDFSS